MLPVCCVCKFNKNNISTNQLNLSITFGSYRLWHKRNNRGFSHYFGGGPFFGIDVSNRKDKYYPVDSLPPSVTTEITERLLKLGMIGIVGVDWSLKESISLHAEYRSNLRYSHLINERTDVYSRTNGNIDTDRIIIETPEISIGSSVLFGVSLYF